MQQNVWISEGIVSIKNFDQSMNLFLDGETRCETAWLTIKCYHELMPEVK